MVSPFTIRDLLSYISFRYHTRTPAEAKKFDEFGRLSTDDIQAHLDLFAEQLTRNEKFRGFVVGYRSRTELPGSHLRKIFGYFDYLASSRGINPEKLEVIDGGPASKEITQLWLAPPGADNRHRRFLFDSAPPFVMMRCTQAVIANRNIRSSYMSRGISINVRSRKEPIRSRKSRV